MAGSFLDPTVPDEASEDLEKRDNGLFLEIELIWDVDLLILKLLKDHKDVFDHLLADLVFTILLHDLGDDPGRVYLILDHL